jgi:hypothetical protein
MPAWMTQSKATGGFIPNVTRGTIDWLKTGTGAD